MRIKQPEFMWTYFGQFGRAMWAKKDDSLGTQFDLWEYGLSRSVAWDCMTSIQMTPSRAQDHPRGADIFETLRRWSDVRRRNLLPAGLRAKLREAEGEWHLYVNEKGEYEFLPLVMLDAPQAKNLRAFVCERNGKRLICYWRLSGEGDYVVPLGGTPVKLHAANRAYLESVLSVEEIKKAWAQAK